MASKNNEALIPGTVVRSPKEEYMIVRMLGFGGFGITYQVERQSDGGTFAMKEFFPATLCERREGCIMSFFSSNSEVIETGLDNFVTEANRLVGQKISHPNVVTIGEVFKANNTAYYIMEFIDGCNLFQYVRRTGGRPLTVPQTLSVMRPIMQVVALLHAHKLTHLDIKHENILLTWEDDGSFRPVLIDFGQSKHYDRKGNATSKLSNAGCSEGFAPPEQYMGLTKFTPQADVYALAATTLYLLTAVQPDKEMSATEITARFDKADPDGTKIPRRVRDAVINGMRRDKESRTQSVEELARELGVEITSHTHEGNVTRLLNLGNDGMRPSLPKVEWKRILRPAVYLVAAAALAGSITYWIANRPKTASTERLAIDSTELIQDTFEENEMDTAIVIPSDVTDMIWESPLGKATYTGEVMEDSVAGSDKLIPHGKGIAEITSGELKGCRYDGQFAFGKMEGNATYTLSNGDSFNGTFKDNKFDKGRYTSKAAGQYFEGTFKNGQPDKGSWHPTPKK